MAYLSDYTSGTVSVAANGTTVTGSGTAWQTAGFHEGDWFIANGWVNVIASVNSNTSLTLAQPWRGGALSGASYRLRYMSDGSRVSAQARQIIDMLGGSGNLEAIGALASAPNTMPYFTGSGTAAVTPLTPFARTLLDDADAGEATATLTNGTRLGSANKFITDWNDATENGWYTGQPSALNAPVAAWCMGLVEWHGGAGYGTQTVHEFTTDSASNSKLWRRQFNIGSWGPWYRCRISEAELDARYFNRLNILGTVSQSAGAPTGAIIESGNNANGYYEKYADGGMSCWFFDTTPRVCTNPAALPFYSSAAFNLTFPAAFIGKPSLFYSAHRDVSGASGFVFPLFGSAPFTTSTYARMSIGGLSDGATGGVCYLARGRWF